METLIMHDMFNLQLQVETNTPQPGKPIWPFGQLQSTEAIVSPAIGQGCCEGSRRGFKFVWNVRLYDDRYPFQRRCFRNVIHAGSESSTRSGLQKGP